MFKKIALEKLQKNTFHLIAKEWALLTMQCDGKVNGMTVNWLQMGYLWNKQVVTAYVRPQRYSYEFMNKVEYFSLAFFDEDQRKNLTYCGTVSGRDEDKLAICNYTTEILDNAPVVKEAKLVLVCRSLYVDDLKAEAFLDKELMNKLYNNDLHRLYVAEIVAAYSQE